MSDTGTASVELPAVPLEHLDLSFEDLTYSVRTGLFQRERKAVVRGASGAFRAGELSVIVGQSGAGKSTLMNILAGYTSASSGRVLVNGRPRDERYFRPRSCYIMQNDMLQPLLTVQEALAVAAELKLGSHVGHTQKINRADELVEALGLTRSRHTRTGALSGGQRKRLAVGLELVSDPPVMFLDEPTSGLDSSTSKQVVSLLRMLARQGRTLVVTMHQPSTPLLLMMDRLYAVMAGQCAYMGAVPNLIPYLDSLGLHIPPYHNPVDFLMEVCSLGATTADRLVAASGNGRSEAWTTPLSAGSGGAPVITNGTPCIFEDIRLTALPPLLPKHPSKFRQPRRYPTTFSKQFSTLFIRALRTIWRDPSLTGGRLLIHGSMALLLGLLYHDIGDDAKYLQDNCKFLFFSLMFLMFTAFSGVTLTFPVELPIVRREHLNRWYSTGAYYAASVAASVPVQTVCSLLYAVISYWMTGQPPELMRFLLFTFMLTLVSLIAMCMGFLNGVIFDVKHGVVFGPLVIMPFTIFAGFFLSYKDAADRIKWLFHLSFLKHGYVGLCLSTFGWERKKMACTKDFCEIIHPYVFLEKMEFDHEIYSMAVLYLYLIAFVVVTSAYAILRFRLKRKM